MKLLITSVGSLLGQNILDSIESRRGQIEVCGMNTISENARNFRCDTNYLVHNTLSPEFEKDFKRIIEKEQPDFILPGRDADCVFLTDFKEKHPREFVNKIPFGSSVIPKMMFDKHQSFLFCQKYGLPFADSFFYKNKADKAGLDDFVEKHTFPLLTKPREGFGSLGVQFILNREQLIKATQNEEIFFQEYLGNPNDILKYEDFFNSGIPLFFQIPENNQYAAQTIISPDGSIGEVFFVKASMMHGRAEESRQIHNKEVEELVHRFAKAFYANGWYGPANFQLKQDRKGQWKVFELNPRLTGTSSGRTLMGFDEFGMLCDIFIPELNISNLTKKEKVQGTLIKYLTDYLLLDEDVEQLKTNKVWKKS